MHALDPHLADLIAQHRAPLRIAARYRLAASPRQVFSILGDLEGITRFFPMIHHAKVDHAAGCPAAGSVRVCAIRGMGELTEKVLWWHEPGGYAYRADGPWVPLRDHMGVIQIASVGDGTKSLVDWRQYFDTRYGPMGWMFPIFMRAMMGRAMVNIGKLLGASCEAVRG